MNDDDTNPADEGEDAFAGLESQATALEGAAESATNERAQAQAAETIASTSAELFDALKFARSMARPIVKWWQEFDTTWSDDALQGIAQAGAEVMQKHGWTMGQAWAHLGPYIALIAATAPPAFVTWEAVRERRAQLAYQQRQHQARPAVMPIAETMPQAAP